MFSFQSFNMAPFPYYQEQLLHIPFYYKTEKHITKQNNQSNKHHKKNLGNIPSSRLFYLVKRVLYGSYTELRALTVTHTQEVKCRMLYKDQTDTTML